MTGEQHLDLGAGDTRTVPSADPSRASSVSSADRGSISVLLPAYNEAQNLSELVPELAAVLARLTANFEILIVDDGSTDDTARVLERLAFPRVRYVKLRKNTGKSAALAAGIARAKGDVIVFMDADGQDDPGEIPRLIASLDDVDLVSGRRANRNDRFIKRSTSKLYNAATSLLTGVKGRDFNTGLKAMRREVAMSLSLYGDLHRYIPILARWNGFRFAEIDVVHHRRRHGTSKFGSSRFLRGFLDLITVKFLTTYTARPLHLFGGAGFLLGLVGSGLLAWMLVLRITGEQIGDRPALLTGILLIVVAVQMVSLGLVAELVVSLRRQRELDAPIERDVTY